MTFEVHKTHIRGLKTAWLEAGKQDAPILLLLHGFPDTAECWDKQIAWFEQEFHIIAPFVRGAQPSEPSGNLSRYSPDAIAFDILEILAKVDPEKKRQIYIVGHDLGGVHAWHVSRLIQSRLSGLVIINGLTIQQMMKRFKNPRQLAKSWYMFLMQTPKLPEYLFRSFPLPFLDMAHALGGLHGPARPSLQNLRGALAGPMNQYRAFFREVPKLMSGKSSKRLSAPVLVLWGAEDAFLLPPSMDEMETEAEKVTVRILPGNHWIHRNDAERVNTLIGEFFNTQEMVVS